MKILIIYGPNLPLLGKVSVNTGSRLTLDKLNKTLRKEAALAGVELKIYQHYSEENIIKTISRSRNEIDGILICPGALVLSAYCLRELIEIIQIPIVEVCIEEFPRSLEVFEHSVIKNNVKARFIGEGAGPFLQGLNSLLE